MAAFEIKDGVLTKEFTLAEVRANLHGGNF